MKITFIGNCQMVALCYFFQQLLLNTHHDVRWVTYGEEFLIHLAGWSDKCKNKITYYGKAIDRIKKSDVIIYQNVDKSKSSYCNTEYLKSYKQDNCKLICLPSIFFKYENFNESLRLLREREEKSYVDVKVSEIFLMFKDKQMMLSINHPKTFLFLFITNRLCKMLGFKFFPIEKYNLFMSNNNFMGLPNETTNDI